MGAPEEEGRSLGTDEDVGGRGGELLGLGDADLGQVEAGEEGVVAADEGDGRVLDLAGDRDAGRWAAPPGGAMARKGAPGSAGTATPS